MRYTASGTARSDLARLARLLVRRRETRTEALELHLDLAQLGPASAR